ncbi:MAG: hypothetical protein PHG06_20065, partial [Parabacteroides sp.]|nr:hypothetical protein [Parabacteroides sp.]
MNDSIKAKDLFFDEVAAFHRLDEMLKGIYYELLKERREFYAFFHFLGMSRSPAGIEDAIH